ncbi:MAG: prepilin-type N-terminal cleavage/methylation domain-containing protein [Verrucomicrobiae bacterium]
MREKGFSLVELLAVIFITLVLAMVAAGAGWKVYASSSLAVSANNIRQMAAGGANYLAEHNHVFWPWCEYDFASRETIWWWGRETDASKSSPEGSRDFDPSTGPLGAYIPKGIRPDPSLSLGGSTFKPKFRNGYIGTGYNTLLGGGWYWSGNPILLQNFWQLADPSKVVVFFTSAQVNAFQSPASATRPMIEEFYGVDARERTVHFRHNGKAMVSFASGNAGFLEMDETTRDTRMPKANVGRFAPVGSTAYLK